MPELNEVNTGVEASVQKVEVVKIPAANVSKEDTVIITEAIQTDMGDTIVVKAASFSFKKSKDKDGVESMREVLNLPLPYPSVEGIVAIIEAGGAGLALLNQALETVVKAEAREIIQSDVELGGDNFPYAKLNWATIAAKPKAQRGGGIPKEVWELFVADYTAVMIEHSGKSVEQVGNAATLLKGKLNNVRTNKAALKLLVSQLSIYAEHTQALESVEVVVTFLLEKAETYLNVTDEQLLASL